MSSIIKKLTTNRSLVLILFCIIYLFPARGLGVLSGIPYNTETKLASLFIFIFLLFKNFKEKKNLYLFTILFLIKIFLIFFPANGWEVCIESEITPKKESYTFPLEKKECEMSFDSVFTDKTIILDKVNFSSQNIEYEFLGVNSSNFPLSYLNQSAYNFYDKNRFWLPFSTTLIKNPIEQSTIEIEYIGDLLVSVDNSISVFPSNYINSETIEIVIPKDTVSIEIKYKFSKGEYFENQNSMTYKEVSLNNIDVNYAKLIINEEQNNNFDLLLIFQVFFLSMMLYINRVVLTDLRKNKSILILILILTSLIFKQQLNQINFLNFSIFTFVGYFFIFYLYKYTNRKEGFLSLLNIYLLIRHFFTDPPWDLNSLFVKFGGSDSLTYENFSRLIIEGDLFRGGENIFFYSPGYRYFLTIFHIIFGENWITIWTLILSSVIFMVLYFSEELTLLRFLTIVFLLSDTVRAVFVVGMSETIALLFVVASLYSLKFYKNNYLLIFLISTFVLIRPNLLFLSILFFLSNYKIFNKKQHFMYFCILLLPLMHNIYFGRSFVLFTNSFLTPFSLNFDPIKNLNYIIFNPFNSDIVSNIGIQQALLGFLIVIIGVLNLVNLIKNKNIDKNSLTFIYALSVILPYLVYDPSIFFPRHLIIAISLVGLTNLSITKVLKSNNKLKRESARTPFS